MHRDLRIMTMITASFYGALGAGGAFIGLFLEELGASYFQISLVLALFIVTTIGASALYGRLADRLGARRAWLAAGLLLQSLAYVMIARAHTLEQAASARVVEGIGAALYAAISLSIVGELLKSSPVKGRQMGVYRGIGSVAYAVGALVGGLVADRAGISASLLLGGASYAVGALLTLRLHAGPRPRFTSPHAAVVEGAAPQAAPAPRTALPRAFLAGVVLVMAAIAASSSMFPLYLNALGRSRATIGSLWSLTAVLEFPAMYFTGILSDTVGRAPLLAAGAVAMALVQFLYIGAARFSVSVILGQFVRSFGYASFTSNAMTYTADMSGEADRAANSGLFILTQNAGQLGGLLLGGAIAQAAGFGALFGFCAVLAVCAALSFLVLSRTQQSEPVMRTATAQRKAPKERQGRKERQQRQDKPLQK